MSHGSPWEGEGEAEEEGESWLISYADMVTLLFGFFVILFSLSVPDEKKMDALGQKVAGAFKGDPNGAPPKEEVISDKDRQVRALQMLIAMMSLGDGVDDAVAKIEKSYTDDKSGKALDELIKTSAKDATTSIIKDVTNGGDQTSDDQVDLVLPGALLFAPGTFNLTPAADVTLRKLAAELTLGLAGITGVDIEGHTDQIAPTPTAAFKTNFQLSSMRAGAVADALLLGGLPGSLISVRGYGSLKPLFPERDEKGRDLPENRIKNRRVHIVIKKKHHAEIKP